MKLILAAATIVLCVAFLANSPFRSDDALLDHVTSKYHAPALRPTPTPTTLPTTQPSP